MIELKAKFFKEGDKGFFKFFPKNGLKSYYDLDSQTRALFYLLYNESFNNCELYFTNIIILDKIYTLGLKVSIFVNFEDCSEMINTLKSRRIDFESKISKFKDNEFINENCIEFIFLKG